MPSMAAFKSEGHCGIASLKGASLKGVVSFFGALTSNVTDTQIHQATDGVQAVMLDGHNGQIDRLILVWSPSSV